MSDYKEGYSCASIALSLAFTTGLAAYTALPATLNLSGYQQVSFWIKQTAGTLGAAGAVRLALCSDAVGATVVNALDIPVIGALSTWQQVTVNLGTNLGSSINSVAFYVITDNGAQTFLIDNIIACKATSSADSLNLTSLISKSDGTGDEAWYAIQSINYDAVMLANTNVALSTGPLIRGYLGSTGTVSTYKRETIKIAPVASATTGSSTVTDSGNAGSLITYSGGWNRTDMSTQTGFTWYDGQNGLGRQYYIGNFSYIKMERLCLVRGYSPAQSLNSSTNCQVYSMYATANTQGSFVGGLNHYYDLLWINNNQNNVYISNAAGIVVNTVKTSANAEQNCFAMTSTSFGVVKDAGALTGNTQGTSSYQAPMYFASAANCSIANLNITGSGGYAISCGGATTAVVVEGGSCTNSAYSGVNVDNGTTIYLNNFTISDATEVNVNQVGSIGVYSNAHDNTQGNNWVFAQGWTANQQTSVIDSPATTSWKLSPTTTNVTSQMPAQLKLGTVVVSAGTLVTVTARMRRSNTGLTVQLVCPGGQISGVSADVISSMTAAADTWETVTITFTPTKAGGVDIYAYAFGGTTYSGYVCNLTASQA